MIDSFKIWAILLNIALSWALLALIWIVQLTHYPSFKFIDTKLFEAFHHHHTQSITLVVLPLMVSELALSSWLVYNEPKNIWFLSSWILVILIWGSTFLIQVPLHNALSTTFDSKAVQSLITTNWIRTLLWTIKSILALIVAHKFLLNGQ